jgi:hypothetical protein
MRLERVVGIADDAVGGGQGRTQRREHRCELRRSCDQDLAQNKGRQQKLPPPLASSIYIKAG